MKKMLIAGKVLFLLVLILSIVPSVGCAEKADDHDEGESQLDYVLENDSGNIVTTNGTLTMRAVSSADGEELKEKIIWLSSAPNIAVVDRNGVVSGRTTGVTDISCLSLDGKQVYAKTTVRVVPGISSITLSMNEITLLVGASTERSSEILSASVMPENAYYKDVRWLSSDESVATVDDEGRITALKEGQCVVSARSTDAGCQLQGECKITVFKAVSKVSIIANDILWTGESTQIEPIIEPADATVQTVKWESTAPNIASVDSNGRVYGLSVGETTIRCVSTDGSDVVGECTVQVEAKTKSIEFSEKNVNILIGQNVSSDRALTIKTNPENAFYQSAIYQSSDESIVTVDDGGVAHAVGEGTATITAVSSDPDCKIQARCSVTVSRAVDEIVLQTEDQTAYTGTSARLIANIFPENATNKRIKWESSDPTVATVDGMGNVRCLKVGTCEIRCIATDGSEVAAACKLDVIAKVKGLKVSENSVEMLIGAGDEKLTKQLSYETIPVDAFYQGVTWQSSDESVVVVDENGILHAQGVGTAVVSAVSEDPDYKIPATCKVNVGQAVMAIGLNEHEATIYTGDTLQLDAVVSPDIATNQKVGWTSTDTAVATVDVNGNVRGIGSGSTVIICSALDGSEVADQCEVTVRARVKGIQLGKATLELVIGNEERASTYQLDYSVQPEDAFIQTVTWTSSDESVATVDEDGVIRGHEVGTAIITATSDDQTCQTPATCKVTVGKAVSSVRMLGVETVMRTNSTQTIKTEVLPTDAYNKKLIWESSAPDVLTVDGNGNVHAVSTGSAVIKCSTTDGTGIVKEITISSIIPVSQLTPVQQAAFVIEGQHGLVAARAFPEDATNKEIEWSSDSKCVTVDDQGVVTGVSVGTATVTGTAKDGGGAKCTVRVVVEPKLPVELTTMQQGNGVLTYGTLYFTFTNKCSSVAVTKVTYSVRLSGKLFIRTKSNNTFDFNTLISPGGSVTDSNYFPKFKDAKHYTVTIESVVLSDGTVVECGESYYFDIDG